jgi:hypothetical protein
MVFATPQGAREEEDFWETVAQPIQPFVTA